MKFVLSIDCDSAAFSNGDGDEIDPMATLAEIDACLQHVQRDLQMLRVELNVSANILDSNGNNVGTWELQS